MGVKIRLVAAGLTAVGVTIAGPVAGAAAKPPVVTKVLVSKQALPSKGGKIVERVFVTGAKKCVFSLGTVVPPSPKALIQHLTLACTPAHPAAVDVTLPANVSNKSAEVWQLGVVAHGPGGVSKPFRVRFKVAKASKSTPTPPVPPGGPPSPPPSPPGGPPSSPIPPGQPS